LQKTIQSIQNQTYNNFEVWIIDGNSSQETQNYLQNLQSPFQFLSEKDFGVYEAMNKGISLSKGQWLYFLGSGDCLKTPLVLEEISKNLQENIGLVFGNIQYKNSVFNSRFSAILWLKNSLHHQAVFFNKSLFENEKYDISYKVLADYDFNLKLFIKKIVVKKIDFIIATCDENGISKNYTWNLYQEEFRLKSNKGFLLFYPFFFLLTLYKFLLRRFLSI
jgi:glycosyltransferase involved in cell wall biosynthesis